MKYENLNTAYLHPERFHVSAEWDQSGIQPLVVSSKTEDPGLMVKYQNSEVTIHSLYDPQKEAFKSVSQFVASSDILVFGLGLGYHIRELVRKFPEIKIRVIEPSKDMFELFLTQCTLSDYDQVEFFIGYRDFEVLRLLPKQPYTFFYLKSYTGIFQRYFRFIERKLTGQPIYELSNQWRYTKFTSNQMRILFIDSSYVLTKECLMAIQNLGHRVHYIHIDKESMDFEEFIKNLMNDIMHFRPDFLLTINHLGFDKEGRLTDLLTEIELPYVSWFVDSPNVILSTFSENISHYANLFVWDYDYLQDVKNLGYPHVDYLPLATSQNVFYPKESVYRYDVSFVGSSMMYAIHKNLKSFVHRPDLLILLEKTAEKFLTLDTRYIEEAETLLESEGFDYRFEDRDQKDDFEAAVLWRATQIYRLSGIRQLESFCPVISGDPNWFRLLDNRYKQIPERWYYDTLIDFYHESKINFNMTSRQMKNAVNQRVFDVPACKKFILTDYKNQLEEIFDVKKDIVYFKCVDEIPDKIKFYLQNDYVREEMAQRAYQKVITHHTYEHRLTKMIEIMKKRYK